MRDVADDRLASFIHRDVLHRDFLLAPVAVPPERFDLGRKCPSQLVEGAFGAVLLRDVVNVRQAAREGHGRHVNGGHLRGELGFHLILRLHALDHRELGS